MIPAHSINIKNRSGKVLCEQNLNVDMFQYDSREDDYVVLRCSLTDSSVVERVAISYTVCETMRVHAFGFAGYLDKPLITDGQITLTEANGFQMSLLSAEGLSGSAVIADNVGRAIGYLGGGIDSSKKSNSQHQSYGFPFAMVAKATGRRISPKTSPSK